MGNDVEVFWRNGRKYVRFTANGLIDGTQVFDTRGDIPRLVSTRSIEGQQIIERKAKKARRRKTIGVLAACTAVWVVFRMVSIVITVL